MYGRPFFTAVFAAASSFAAPAAASALVTSEVVVKPMRFIAAVS